MTRAWLIELRRSPGLWLAPLLVLIGVLAVEEDTGYWVGDWHATSIRAQFSVVILAPALAGCAAWAAGRGRRHGHEPLAATTPRLRLGPAMTQWAALAWWGLVAYLVVIATAAAQTAPAAEAGRPWSSYLIIGVAAMLAYSAVGYGLGWVLPWRVVPPLVALAAFGFLLVLAYDSTSWVFRLGLLYGNLFASPALRPRPAVWLAQLGWAAALVIASFGLVWWRTTPWRAFRWSAPAAGALPLVGAILAAGLLGPGNLAPRPPAPQPFCRGSAPRVCVWPEHAKWADDAAVVAHRLERALAGVYTFPSTVYEQGLDHDASANRPVVRIKRVPVTRLSLVAGLAGGVLPLHTSKRCFLDHPKWLEHYVMLRAWLDVKGAGRIGQDVYLDAAQRSRLRHILSLSRSQQLTWVRATIPIVQTCSLTSARSS